MDPAPKYVVISPVKDEELYIGRTLQAMVNQTLKPVRWIIVDDGSADRTREIVETVTRAHPFIHLSRNPGAGSRQTGVAEVRAFNFGMHQANGLEYDYIAKLDGDLSFEPDYFERLLSNFTRNPRLGIASGVYLEKTDTRWREVRMPEYHAAGASKVVRRECFKAIGGFIAERGWDTVDEIRAMTKGWETRHFPELKMKHWKPEGAGMGLIHTSIMYGEIYYRTGGGALFFVLKVLARLWHPPVIIGVVAMLWGYIRASLCHRKRLVTQEEARCYQSLLNARLARNLRRCTACSR
jgi:poly-beta-1,6-N-acetyl-D-glucosamine synthase